MLVARVRGRASSTVRHRSLVGQRMLVVQPLRSLTTDPVLALDRLGAGSGCLVLISSDGRCAGEMVNDITTPARWTVVAILDDDEDWPGA